MRTRIGTAGWSIPATFAPEFPDHGSHLERYASVLSSVEINSSFYRPHARKTYERWAASVPPTFRFSVKIPKAISHTRRLIDVDILLDAFVEQIAGLGEKLGVVLLQLPPSFAYEQAIVAPFLNALRYRLGDTIGIACEPRHATWFGERANGCLNDHQVARVVADPVLAAGGELPGGWNGLHYYRLHGAPRVYYSAYVRARLEALAQSLANDAGNPDRSWCIFDNTASGAATGDALVLGSLLAAPGARHVSSRLT